MAGTKELSKVKMNAKSFLIAFMVCPILVAGAAACGGEGHSESGRCGGSDGRSVHGAVEARQESDTSARCGGGSGSCDG
ncbi:uncharacterized protein LOC119185430 isoform X5 [Rhipicephalus microplus]|uniref:uncharacterized protein LOC119185430 isoform X5 n=1 Tax=Rhipicephalus microplus TaxID=6941 RepID=UPI003F6BA6AF